MKALLYRLTGPTDALQVTHGFSSSWLEIYVPDFEIGFTHDKIGKIKKSHGYRGLKPIKEFEMEFEDFIKVWNCLNEKERFEKMAEKLFDKHKGKKK